jgi:hypothetical protein
MVSIAKAVLAIIVLVIIAIILIANAVYLGGVVHALQQPNDLNLSLSGAKLFYATDITLSVLVLLAIVILGVEIYFSVKNPKSLSKSFFKEQVLRALQERPSNHVEME